MTRRGVVGSLGLAALLSTGCSEASDGMALRWVWDEGEVLAAPLVADLDDDGTSEVAALLGRVGDTDDHAGALVVLDGATGAVRWRRDDALGRSTPAIGDVDGDGQLDVIYAGRRAVDSKLGPVLAVDAGGDLLWTAKTSAGEPVAIDVASGAPTLAELDGDPGLEFAIGGALFDSDGTLVWTEASRGSLLGSPHDLSDAANLLYPGSLATFADLTGDGVPELLTGRDAWVIAWTPGEPAGVVVEPLWSVTAGMGGDGFPAVADLDGNGTPEVVLVAWPEILVLEGATGELWCGADVTGAACIEDAGLRTRPIALTDAGIGGPPTIADFDGDGRPEVAVELGDRLVVYDFHRDGETIAVPEGDATPDVGAIYTRWSAPIQDGSSASNGVGAFDFDGDGALDLAFQDECYLRLLDGPTGEVRLAVENTSLTVHEYPVVADLDGDGTTELVVAANASDAAPLAACGTSVGESFPENQGVYVYSDPAWASAPASWTTHGGGASVGDSFRATVTFAP